MKHERVCIYTLHPAVTVRINTFIIKKMYLYILETPKFTIDTSTIELRVIATFGDHHFADNTYYY